MNSLFLLVRVLHVVFAAIWFGSVFVATLFFLPAARDAGPAAAPFMAGIERRKYPAFVSSIAGLTVLSGFWLYWRFTAGFDPRLSASTAGKVFGAGGLCGLVALILGGSVVARSMKRSLELGRKASALPDGAERAAIMQSVARLRQRAATVGLVVLGLLTIAIVLMAMGHYV